MNSAPQSPESEEMLEVLRQEMGTDGYINYNQYVATALYHPELGYYKQDRKRVGHSRDADFYTSQSLGKLFGDLVSCAIDTLTGENSLKDYTLVELAYEAGTQWLDETSHPYKALQRIGSKDKLEISGNSVVFSNELFDAQPFHKVTYLNGEWKELGVMIEGSELHERILPQLSPEVISFKNQLPLNPSDGYILDLPLSNIDLLKTITDQNWTGLFIALDYGKSWETLTSAHPYGTARAYHQHQQIPNLLSNPGQQDITCHICWDWLEEGLKNANFQNINLESQEAFFVKHAQDCIEKVITANPGSFDPARQTLMQLLHPANMGQKFQVLWCYRA